jgi:hypothetical protein
MTLYKKEDLDTIEPIHHMFADSNVSRHQAICQKLNDTYRKKNADYGKSFDRVYEENGEVTAIVRLKDKIYRLDALLKKSAEVTDEKKIETALDGANYFIMYAMKLMEKENL